MTLSQMLRFNKICPSQTTEKREKPFTSNSLGFFVSQFSPHLVHLLLKSLIIDFKNYY